MATTPLYANWNYPTAIRFGKGRIQELGSQCQELGIRCPCIVTDPGLAQSTIFNVARERGINVKKD